MNLETMNLEKIFKWTIITQVVIFVAFFVVESHFVTDSSDQTEQTITNTEIFIGIAGLIIVPIHFVSLYLLFTFKPLGKILFVITVVLMTLFFFFLTPIEYLKPISRLSYTLDQLSAMLNGALLVLMYLTSLKDKFVKVK